MASSADDPRLVAVDAGTSGLRAVVIDRSGTVVAEREVPYEPTHLPGRGVEQDAETWIAAMETALAGVAPAAGTPAALAVTSQRATIVPVDATGRALHPAISWRDRRSEPQCARLASRMTAAELQARTGLRLDSYFSLPKILWLRDERPAAFAAARQFLTVHDLLVHHLTGRFATDWTQASRTLAFDVRRLQWDEDILSAAGLSPDVLPEALPPGTVAGSLRAEVARRVGLSTSPPVVLAGGDQQAAALGLGVVAPGQAEVTTGSGAFVLAPVGEPRCDADSRLLCSPAAVRGSWLLEGSVLTAMTSYRWLRREVAGLTGPTDVEAVLDASPPGARGVLALPRLAGAAAPRWDPSARGVLFNLGLEHTADDLGRAVLEGIVHDAAGCLAEVERVLGGPLSEVRVSGSAAASDHFNQLQADAFGRPVLPTASRHATALGAAILAAVAVGVHDDLTAAVAAMTRTDTRRGRVPDPARSELYERLRALRESADAALAASGAYREAASIADR
ncbi:MAG TPA: FGGY-family carbohydrate kinase [Baekduia sp.]|nr:FGGY-family carbohydrate kinase [Baekduia sp.]